MRIHVVMFRLCLILASFFPCCHSYALEALELSFAQLNVDDVKAIALVANGKEVKIRGFLYQDANKEWILASEPNLKTCCVGSQTKILQQIRVIGTIADQAYPQVMALKGVMFVESQYDDNGDLVSLYRLENATIAIEKPTEWPLQTLCICLFAFGLLLVQRYRNKRYKRP